MNYRLAFILLFILSFKPTLTNNEPEQIKDYIKLSALDCAENRDEQSFRSKLKKYNLPFPSAVLLALTSKELEKEASSQDISQNECLRKIRASDFLDRLAEREGRPWFRKFQQDYPRWNTAISFILGMLITMSLSRNSNNNQKFNPERLGDIEMDLLSSSIES